MIWSSNNKWGSKLRQKQAPQNRSTPRLLPPTWASAAESPSPSTRARNHPKVPLHCRSDYPRVQNTELPPDNGHVN